MQNVSIDAGDGSFVAQCSPKRMLKQLSKEGWGVAFEITDVERGVQRPIILLYEEDFSNGSVPSRHNSWSCRLLFVVESSNARRGDDRYVSFRTPTLRKIVAPLQGQ